MQFFILMWVGHMMNAPGWILLTWSFGFGTMVIGQMPWNNGHEAMLIGNCLKTWSNEHYPNGLRQWLLGKDDQPIVMGYN